MTTSAFQIAFWIVSICFAAFGLFITIQGWKVSARNAESLARTKDINDSIDKCIQMLSDLEDSAYSFWLHADSQTKPYQLVVAHTRLTARLNQLQNLRNCQIPNRDLASLRRHCTMDAETRCEPLSSEDVRIKRISKATTGILQSEILEKVWGASTAQTA